MIVAISDADARAMISVFGALLAAFGFFYTSVKDEVREGTPNDPKDDDGRIALRGAVVAALWPGITILAVSAIAVVALMIWPVIDAARIEPDQHYSPSQAALVAIGGFWVVLALYWGGQLVRALYRRTKWK